MRPKQTLAWRALANIVVMFVRLMGWRVDVRGLNNVPRAGGAVLAFNHHSYADFLMIALEIHRTLGREIRFLAKREIWQSRWTGWIVRAGRAVPVDRTSRTGRSSAYEDAVQALLGGDLVAVAPEQTISRSFELLPFRTGAVRMAQAAGVPIVPAIGWGSHRFATKGQRIRWSARGIPVTVHYGEPFRVGPDDDVYDCTRELERRMTALLEDVQGEYPDQGAPGDDWWVPARLGGTAPTHQEVLAQHETRLRERWGEHGPGHRTDHVDESGRDDPAAC